MPVTATKPVDPKLLGAFYTPETIAGMLAEWVVQTGSERLLEPSVGDGALVAAAIARRQQLRGARGELRFLACDIDPSAIEAMEIRLPDTCETRVIDFLQLDPASTGLFSAVITNPPFTRNHSIEPARREVLRKRFGVAGAAGLWVHFLIHSMEFVAPRGRLAAVVPAAALFTNYGQSALLRVCERFAHVEIRQIVDKPLWINGADERGAIVLASGFGVGSSPVPTPSRWLADGRREPQNGFASDIDAFEKLEAASQPLDDIATIAIGSVTGCNAVFLMDEAERLAFAVSPSDVTPIASPAATPPASEGREPHPRFHFQRGGHAQDAFAAQQGFVPSQGTALAQGDWRALMQYPGPRIPSLPFDPILAIDFCIAQNDGPLWKQLRALPEYRGLVEASQIELWKPFIERLNDPAGRRDWLGPVVAF